MKLADKMDKMKMRALELRQSLQLDMLRTPHGEVWKQYARIVKAILRLLVEYLTVMQNEEGGEDVHNS